MIELASEGAGEDVSFARTRDELVAILERNGGHAEDAWGKGKLIAEIFEAVAEEKLIQPTFVMDHPLEVSPAGQEEGRRARTSPSASSCSSAATSTPTPSAS